MNNEGYPLEWKHCVVHYNPDTETIHIDGDHDLRTKLWGHLDKPHSILEEMFEKQKELNIRVGKNPENLNDEQITKWTQDYLSALSNECEELRSHTGWKWWKAYTEPVDRNQMKIEIVDMFHFLVSLALPLMDANEFADLYFKKLGLNHKRQEIGYDDKYEKEHKQKGKEDNDELFWKEEMMTELENEEYPNGGVEMDNLRGENED